MSGLDPTYGQTPLPFDELEMLLPAAAEALGSPVTRAAVYELEQTYEGELRQPALPMGAHERLDRSATGTCNAR